MDQFGYGSPEQVEDTDKANKEIEICSHVRSLVEEQKSAASRMAHENIWMSNIAAILGLGGLQVNAATRRIEPVNRPASRGGNSGIYVNKILPNVQIRQAKICKNPPRYDVRPESNDTEDKEACRLGLDILNWIWDKQGVDEKRLNLVMWLQQCGHAYFKTSWDPTLGKEMVDPVTNEIDYEGDVRVDVVSAFEIYPDPLAKTLDDAQWIIQAKIRKLDYFKMQYPEKGAEVEAEDCWLLSLQIEDKIKTMNNKGPVSSQLNQNMKNCAIELIKYEKRSKEHPNGRMIVVANGVLLEDKELPIGEIPFAKFDDIAIGGKYYSEAIVTHARPIQDQYNQVVQRRASWTNKMLAGKLIAARGTGLTQESLSDQSGEVVYHDIVPNAPNGGQPVPMMIPQIPQYAYQEEERLDAMLSYIFGISEVSRGQIPAAGIPAIGMQLLLEEDSSRIGTMIEQHERSYAKTGGFVLKYVEKFYDMPRKMKIAGKSNGYMVRNVQGNMIRGNTDVIVIRGSTLPNSKVLRRQELINLYTQGLLGDPNDPKVRSNLLGALELGEIGEAWRNQSLNEFNLELGIKQIEAGELPKVHKLDDHDFWVNKLNEYRKEKMGELSLETAAIIETCINKHLEYQADLLGLTEKAPLPDPISPEIPDASLATPQPMQPQGESL